MAQEQNLKLDFEADTFITENHQGATKLKRNDSNLLFFL